MQEQEPFANKDELRIGAMVIRPQDIAELTMRANLAILDDAEPISIDNESLERQRKKLARKIININENLGLEIQ